MIKYLIGLLLTVLGLGIYYFPKNVENPCAQISSADFKALPSSTSQVILVRASTGIKAQVTACQCHDSSWTPAFKSSFIAVLGGAGIAPVGEKREGDKKTPAGLYPLGEAFGTQALALKMDYKYITSQDKFIDDATHKQYNSWVHGETDAKSYEAMFIKPYKIGLVVKYNMNPIVPGLGSAIFMHLWQSENKPTVGCIAMDEPHLLALLQWLDKAQHPYVSIAN